MTELSLQEIKKEWHGTIVAYVKGLSIALLLTGISFLLVIFRPFASETIFHAILGLAVVQAGVQLHYFLHLGQEAKPRWESFVFAFAFTILLVVLIGSLWIMNDLDMRMMPMEMPHD